MYLDDQSNNREITQSNNVAQSVQDRRFIYPRSTNSSRTYQRNILKQPPLYIHEIEKAQLKKKSNKNPESFIVRR